MPTVREALTVRIDRLTARHTVLQAELATIGQQIADLTTQLNALRPVDDAVLAKLQELGVLKATD